MRRAKRLVKLVGAWMIVLGGPGCAAFDEWDEDEYYEVEYRTELPQAGPANPPARDVREPGIYREEP